jgi:hypothetical protein
LTLFTKSVFLRAVARRGEGTYSSKTEVSELLHNRGRGNHVKKFSKIFLEMTAIWVKTCGESEFGIFGAKKRFSDSRRAVY